MMKLKPLKVEQIAKVFLATLVSIQSADQETFHSDRITKYETKENNFKVTWRRDFDMEKHYETVENWPPTVYFIVGFSDDHNPYYVDVLHVVVSGPSFYLVDGQTVYEAYNTEETPDTEESQAIVRKTITEIIIGILTKMSINGLIVVDRGHKRGKDQVN